MHVHDKTFSIPAAPGHRGIFNHIEQALPFRLNGGESELRFLITRSDPSHYQCELGLLSGHTDDGFPEPPSVFRFIHRSLPNSGGFNAVLVVPTGIGSEIGGHAGDAMPVARLLAEACDTLITHPNVVNASDINEMPENSLYVEGSILSRFLMGTAGLQKVRSNRVLVVIDAHKDELFSNAAINAVSAARASYGLNCPKVIQLDPPVKLKAHFTKSGTAAGEIENLDYLCEILRENRDAYDAVAISSVIDVPESYHQGYFDAKGEMVNPWGGVEAMLTHAVSSLFDVPSAHSPMFESQEIANADSGVVDPRMAAEAISVTFLQCILKGLQRSPKIVTDESAMNHSGVLTAADVSCLVIPDGCLGLPTLAALEQGIPVIAVRENQNLMRNDLAALPWAVGQLHIVENYWEAAGVMLALRSGLSPASVRRPLADTQIELCRRETSGKRDAASEMKSRLG